MNTRSKVTLYHNNPGEVDAIHYSIRHREFFGYVGVGMQSPTIYAFEVIDPNRLDVWFESDGRGSMRVLLKLIDEGWCIGLVECVKASDGEWLCEYELCECGFVLRNVFNTATNTIPAALYDTYRTLDFDDETPPKDWKQTPEGDYAQYPLSPSI